MIEVKTDKAQTSVSVKGSLSTLIADTAVILKSIRRAIADESPMGGVVFSVMLTKLINDPKNSPLKAPLLGEDGMKDEAEVTIDFAELMRQMGEEHDGKMD